MSKSLCITTVVNEQYQEFIPWFVYFLSQSYPHYDIKLFLNNNIKSNVKKCLSLFDHNCTLYPKYFSEYPKNVLIFKALRWILNPLEFRNFDYIYMGDIDMLICEEKPDLLSQHIEHCKILGLPYSNQIRCFGKWYNQPRRLTGLHFVHQKEWYSKMSPVMKKYDRLLKQGKMKYTTNEALLYQMVKESEIDLPKDINGNSDPAYRFRPHHGLHLGLWRNLGKEFTRTKEGRKMFTGHIYKQYFEQFKLLMDNKIYTQLYANLPRPRIMLDRMIKFYKDVGY